MHCALCAVRYVLVRIQFEGRFGNIYLILRWGNVNGEYRYIILFLLLQCSETSAFDHVSALQIVDSIRFLVIIVVVVVIVMVDINVWVRFNQ